MKKTFLGKLLIVITIVVLLLNFYLLPPVQAGWLEDMLTSVIALLTLPIRAVAIACGWAINALTAGLAYMEGTTDGSAISNFITPFDILFNKVQLFDINFFDIKTSGTEAETLVNQIRLGVAGWYYALRNISAAILLCILIYVGIRMAITTIASDKAMYKKMLVDWIASMLLLFLMHYIMLFTINVNNTIINALSAGINSEKIEQIYEVVKTMALDPWDLNGLAATAIYCMLVWQTLGLVFAYFNRLLKLAFLTIIAPLVTITYSLDKMGDGKAQALNNWLKEYIYTILIQPFHCVIYMSLIDIGLNVLIDKAGTGDDINILAAAVISMMCVKFTKDGEQLVRKIFAFQDDGSTGLGAGLAVAAGGLMYAKNIGKSARSTVNGARNIARTGKNAIRGIGSGIKKGSAAMVAASGALVDNYKTRQREGYEKSIDKQMDKMYGSSESYKNSSGQYSETDEEYEARRAAAKAVVDARNAKKLTSRIKNSDLAQNVKKSRNERKEKRTEKKNVRKENRNRKIGKARKTLSRMRDIRDNSTVIKGLSDGAKVTMSAGMAMFVGSGSLGIGQDFSSSLMSAATVYKGANEFMKGTRTTLRRGVKDHLQAMGINSKMQMHAALPGILNLHGDSDAAKDKEDSIMKELEKALQDAGLNTSNKSMIKNTIQRAAKADPGKTGNAIDFALNAAIGDNKRSPEEMANVRAAAQSLADFYNGPEVYKSFETAAGFGLTADTFAADVMKGFYENGTESSQAVEEVVEDDVEVAPVNGGSTESNGGTSEEKTEAKPQTEASTETYENIKRSKDAIQKQIDELEADVVDDQLQTKLTEIEAEERKFEEQYKQQLDREVEDILQRTEQDLQSQVEEIIKREQAKIDAGQIPTSISSKFEEYRSKIEQANSSAQE